MQNFDIKNRISIKKNRKRIKNVLAMT